MQFGPFVRRTREECNMALSELAMRTKISIVYMSRIERGREAPPPDRLLLRIADALDLPHDEAFAAAGRLPPDLRPRTGELIRLYREHVAQSSRAA